MNTTAPDDPTIAGAAWRHRWLVLALVVVGLIAAAGFSVARGSHYSASASVLLQDPRPSALLGSQSQSAEPEDRYTADQISVLQSRQVATIAASVAAGHNPSFALSPDDFLSHTQVTGSQSTTNLVDVSFTASGADDALVGANAVVTAYERVVHDVVAGQLSPVLTQLTGSVKSLDDEIGTLEGRLGVAGTTPSQQQALTTQIQSLVTQRTTLASNRDQIAAALAQGNSGVALDIQATKAQKSSRLTSALPTGVGAAVLGLLIGVGIAYALELRRPVIQGNRQPERILEAPLIADVPPLGRGGAVLITDHGFSERAQNAVRLGALFLQAHRPADDALRAAIVSPGDDSQRGVLTANIGIALAMSGASVLIVDADVAHNEVTRLLLGKLAHAPSGDVPTQRLAHARAGLERLSLPGAPGSLRLLRLGTEGRRGQTPAVAEALEGLLADLSAWSSFILLAAPPVSELNVLLPVAPRLHFAIAAIPAGAAVGAVTEMTRTLQLIDLRCAGYVYVRPLHKPLVGLQVGQSSREQSVTRYQSRIDAAP